LYHNNNSTRSEDDWGAELFLQNRNINNTYQNNIIIANSYLRVDIGSLNSGIVWGNNLYSGTAGSDVPTAGNPVFGNPAFVNAASANFNLTSSSAAIDMGINSSASIIGTLDFNKSSRTIGTSVDIGAIEYNSVLGFNDSFGKNDESSQKSVKVFPNPAEDYILFLLQSDNARLESYRIIDINGKVWMAGEVDIVPGSEQIRISVSQLPSQIFFLILQYEDKIVSDKFIKK
jgi:hypothetical protein